MVPDPTVTEGIISHINPSATDAATTTYSQTGDMYQLTVPTGNGNSGGPVFDASGRVVGLLTLVNRERETITYATPIKYGRLLRDLLNGE